MTEKSLVSQMHLSEIVECRGDRYIVTSIFPRSHVVGTKMPEGTTAMDLGRSFYAVNPYDANDVRERGLVIHDPDFDLGER